MVGKDQSLFQGIKLRELNGFRVRKPPVLGDNLSESSELATGVLALQHNGEQTPPLAISFCKTSNKSYLLAVTDEDGYVTLYDTRRQFHSFASYQENAEKARVSDWIAHHNAIFDVCWIKDDSLILTASGDQTIKVWNAQEKKCTGVLVGHTGSVKSLCSHSTNPDLLVSGSRDGSFALWDLRCKSSYRTGDEELCVNSTAMVSGAHVSPPRKRVRRGKAASMSITSVVYLKDGVSIATAGAVDSLIKFWDTRNLKTQLSQTSPYIESLTQKVRSHGISSMSQDSHGVFLSASCMDNRIYLYNVLQLEKGPIKSFSGCQIESFFVKTVISPDAAHILSGSSDGNAYIWQVDKPQLDPIQLKSHEGEVTAVAWSQYEFGHIATSSDDFTVRLWDIKSSYRANTRSPSSIRKRVMAIPTMERRELFVDKEPSDPKTNFVSLYSSDEVLDLKTSIASVALPDISTPKSKKYKLLSSFELKEASEGTPEAAIQSPSSVLNPPPSLKRKTIRDYFLAAS